MTMLQPGGPAIVVFGATGFTGELVVKALVRYGVQPVLAGRSQEKLDRLAGRLGGLSTRVADVGDPRSVRALVDRGDVLITTVGPFDRWGKVALLAAIDAGAHYLDSADEPGFNKDVFISHDPAARDAGSLLLTGFGYQYVAGHLAGALALQAVGDAAVRLDIGYFATGSALRDLSCDAELGERGVLRFPVHGRPRSAFATDGAESFTLPRTAPQLREVNVCNGWFPHTTRTIQAVSDATVLPRAVKPLANAADPAQSVSSGSDEQHRAATRSRIVAIARDADGRQLQEIHLEGPSNYDLTAEVMAWGATQLSTSATLRSGAHDPVEAFGLPQLTAGCATIGLTQVAELHLLGVTCERHAPADLVPAARFSRPCHLGVAG
jgi:hypothetical protein